MRLIQSVLELFFQPNPIERNKMPMQGQLIARRYCFSAVILFAAQGLVALMGAADLIIADLPEPVPFEYGRSIHLGLATLWPLIGSMGLVYYFIVEELGHDIYSVRLARWQFWLVFLSSGAIFASLALRIGNGREYLEGLPIFYLGIGLGLALAAFNLIGTLLADKAKITPAASVMTVGTVLLFIMLVPNLFSYSNPVADEAVKFWVVHSWEEMALELVTAGFVASFFKSAGLALKQDLQKWLYLEVTVTVVTGLFGTGHHYYWIGFPGYWILIGSIFSLLQLFTVGFLLHITYKGLRRRMKATRREKLTLWLVLSSIFYHVLGAYILGFIITIPWINLYVHGTLFTSGHAHLAVFGAVGFLVLGGSYYCLSAGSEPTQKGYLAGVLAVLCLNTGLLTMSSALMVGGLLQTYLWRVLGIDFMQVMPLLKPYLIIRMIGGVLFTCGDLLLGWRVFKAWKETKVVRTRLQPAEPQ